jgi:hypothetical protein
MPVITTTLSRDGHDISNGLTKRDNWAGEEPGVILVFCIVFIVGCGIFAVIVQRAIKDRREEREKWVVTEIKDDNYPSN